MSKTFKSALDSPVTLEVERETHPAGVYLTIGQATILLGASDAPALALAILEASGWPEQEATSVTHTILSDLNRVVEFQERAKAEAEAQAKLEAEALELMNVRLRASGTTVHLTKATVDPVALEGWLAVARRAREINKEDNNA